MVDSYNTYKEVVEDTPITTTDGNTKIISYRRKNKYTDKDKKITFDEPEIYNTLTEVTRTEVIREVHYEDDSDCFIF